MLFFVFRRYKRDLERALSASVRGEAAREAPLAPTAPPAAEAAHQATYEQRQREMECIHVLRGMGFTDGEKIIMAVKQARGHAAEAIAIVLAAEEQSSEAAEVAETTTSSWTRA